MRFRPCIDIHNGKVKQIVGGSLTDKNNAALENFVSMQDGKYYAKLYKSLGLYGGHIILLNPVSSEFYNDDVNQALLALHAWPNALQLGGGINPDNAKFFLDNGASHVIVTSYVFSNGSLNMDNLKKLVNTVGKERLVLDLSCRKKNDAYYIVTDRWQKFTSYQLTDKLINELSSYCSEFLIHAVDAEGKANGIEKSLVKLMANASDFPITYAGGIGSYDDLSALKALGQNKLDVTVGSALEMFGGSLKLDKILEICK